MSIQQAPCTWEVDYTDCTTCTALDSLPASGVESVEEMATTFLWNWTGRQFGLCEVTVRPCRDGCTEGMSTFGRPPGKSMWNPALIGGQWFNLGCGVCGDVCGCQDTPVLTLPGPIDSVQQVVIDGVVLDPSDYRVDNHRWLVRLDGSRWPTCQDLSAPAVTGTEGDGNFYVTYTKGVAVPVGGQKAAGVLACELAKAMCGLACSLPRRVQSITREGVVVAAILDEFSDIESGRTGIWFIDSWVASVMKRPVPSFVRSPDVPVKPRRTTWTG